MTWFLTLILTSTAAGAADKTACTSRELKRFDCRMNSGGHKMRLLPDSIARDDGIWHTVDEMPLKGDWEKMQFAKMGNRPILQMWIWDQGSGETKVQSLHWYVAEVGKSKMVILAEGTVRRRHLRSEKPGDFIFDGYEKHEIKGLKNGDLEWKLGSQKKILGPVALTEPIPEDHLKSSHQSDPVSGEHSKTTSEKKKGEKNAH